MRLLEKDFIESEWLFQYDEVSWKVCKILQRNDPVFWWILKTTTYLKSYNINDQYFAKISNQKNW